MSAYTSGNKAPTLMAQAPNRVGNKSKDPTAHKGGVTAVTRSAGGLSQPSGAQGAPKAGGNIYGNNQKVQVSKPECYDKTPRNDAYMGKSTKNYLG